VPLVFSEAQGAATPRGDKGGETFAEHPPEARGVVATELASGEDKMHGPVSPRQVTDMAVIAAVEVA
jgi:hypothetical protein